MGSNLKYIFHLFSLEEKMQVLFKRHSPHFCCFLAFLLTFQESLAHGPIVKHWIFPTASFCPQQLRLFSSCKVFTHSPLLSSTGSSFVNSCYSYNSTLPLPPQLLNAIRLPWYCFHRLANCMRHCLISSSWTYIAH